MKVKRIKVKKKGAKNRDVEMCFACGNHHRSVAEGLRLEKMVMLL